MWNNAHWRYLEYIFQALGAKSDLLMLGYPVTDELQHQSLALITPTDIDGDPQIHILMMPPTIMSRTDGSRSGKNTFVQPMKPPIRHWPWRVGLWGRRQRYLPHPIMALPPSGMPSMRLRY